MPIELYLGFVAASVALIVFPGPNVSLLIATSIAHGPKTAFFTYAGTTAAVAVSLLITTLGTTSLVLAFAFAFDWLRWIGVAYLLWLGIKEWCSPVQEAARPLAPEAGRVLFWRGFLVSMTNPKTLLFYGAFFPQFIDPAGSPLLQLGLLSATFLALVAFLDGAYVLLAGHLRTVFAGPRSQRMRKRITGSCLIGAGIGLALARR